MVETIQSGHETQQGHVKGTPAYMAPEQAGGKQELVDRRSDIYGLGAILYELLTGRPPFSGDAKQVLAKVLCESPQRPRDLDHQIAPALEAVCLKALSRNREGRYASAETLAREV